MLPREMIRRRGGIPERFQTAFEEVGRHFASSALGGHLRIGLDNSLAMSPYIQAIDGRHVLVIDWALIERCLHFSRFFWSHLHTPLRHQHLVSYLEREILLLAARKAACRRALVSARDYHRGYRGHPMAPALESLLNLDEQLFTAVQIGEALIQRQLARALLVSDPTAADHHSKGMIAHGSLLENADERLRADLYVDSRVLDELSRIDPTAVARGLLGEIILAVAYDEIDSAVEAIAPGFDGYETALDERIMAEERRDHGARLSQIEKVALTSAETHPDPAFAHYLRGMAQLATLLRASVADAMVDGLQALHTHFWDEPSNVKKRNRELVAGLDTDAEVVILGAMCDGQAETNHTYWEMIDARINLPPNPMSDLIPDVALLPGSGRPEVSDWRERLADPGLRAQCWPAVSNR